MIYANTRHGRQGHLMTEHEFRIGSCDFKTLMRVTDCNTLTRLINSVLNHMGSYVNPLS